jgi:hypothetical protein
MLPNVRIFLLNGALGGLIAFAEGVAGMIGTGVAVTGKIGIGDPRTVFNLPDAVSIGITPADNPSAYRQVREFYDEAGNGAELNIMLVPDTMNQTSMWDNTNANGIKKLLTYAQGRIRIAASFFASPGGYTLVTTAGFDADVFTAITNAQVLTTAYADAQSPLRGLVEGRAFIGNSTTATDLLTLTRNRIGVVAASSLADGSGSVGLALGRMAAIPVQRKISRVKDGALTPATMYVGSADAATFSGLALLHDKGYIVPRTLPTKTGYFFSGDHTCAAATDDYCFLSRGRVIDKAAVLAYATFIEELDDEVVINADGTLDIGWIKTMEAKIEGQINGSMTAAREISSVKAYISPTQNALSTNQTAVVLKIVPVGYNTEIDVNLGFDNPAAA